MTTYAYTIEVALYPALGCGCERTMSLFIIRPSSAEAPTLSTQQEVFNMALDAIHSFGLPLYAYYEQASLKEGVLGESSGVHERPDYEKDGWQVYWINKNP